MINKFIINKYNFLLILILLSFIIIKLNCEVNRLPIVYVYTIVPAVCNRGLPIYILASLEQALLTQPDCDIVFVSNFNECLNIRQSLNNFTKLITIDSSSIRSKLTESFHNLSVDIFQMDYNNELWITSALRFFVMEDVMIEKKYNEMLHVEADNLLYGRLTSILPILRDKYNGLAATPLTDKKFFVTASVLWVPNLNSLVNFNKYLYDIASNKERYLEYIHWLRQYACCKRGGIDPDIHGNGVKPFAVNEMSMLAYYHVISSSNLIFLPVLPNHNYAKNRYIVNVNEFSPGGTEVGPPTGAGIWDPNSWGQYIGGTHNRRGSNIGFTDSTHIIGQAIRTNTCKLEMKCDNNTIYQPIESSQLAGINALADSNYYYNTNSSHQCLTSPHVTFTGNEQWIPLWNLHVHSKHTDLFRSHPCICNN